MGIVKKFVCTIVLAAFAALSAVPVTAGLRLHGTGVGVSTFAAMGTNAASVAYFTSALQYINVLKMGSGWQTNDSSGNDTGEEAYFYANMVDANHFPTTLSATGTSVGGTGGASSSTLAVASVSASMWVGGTVSGSGITGSPKITACPAGGCNVAGNYTLSAAQTVSNGTTITEHPTFAKLGGAGLYGWPYPQGNYVFLCDGTDVFALGLDSSQTITCAGAGTRVIVPLNSNNGVVYNVTSVTTATATTTAALVYSPDSTSGHVGTNEALYNSGLLPNPLYTAVTQKTNRSVRFMDMNVTNDNAVQNWSDRSQKTWMFWDEKAPILDIGAPLEVEIAICNSVASEYCWFAFPCVASDDYMVHAADLTHSLLNPTIKIVTESCNEVWLQNFNSQLDTAILSYATPLFGAGSGSNFGSIFSFGAMRANQIARIFRREWGADASRVYAVQAGQNGFSDRNLFLLQFNPFWDSAPFGTFTGVITGCPGACLLTASGITGNTTLGPFSRVSGSSLVTDACWVVSLGTSTGGNGTANLGGSGCANVSFETMNAQMWGSAPGAVGNVSISGATLTVNSTASGSFGVGQYLWIVNQPEGSNFAHGIHIVSGSGSTWTLSSNLGTSFPGSFNIVAAAVADVDGNNVNAFATAPYFNTDPPLAITADGDGGVARMLSQATTGSLLPVSTGRPTTAGTTTAYTLTSGHSFSTAPANGTCIAVQFHANNTGTATIAVDSIGALPLFDYTGVAITAGNTIQNGSWGGGLANVLCYTNATSAGSVTAGWYTNNGSFGQTGGDVAGSVAAWAADYAAAQTFGLPLFGYEGGQQYVDATGITSLRTLITNMNADPGMGTAYTQWMTGLKGVIAGTPINHYNDIGEPGAGNAFGALTAVTESGSSKYNALANFTTH